MVLAMLVMPPAAGPGAQTPRCRDRVPETWDIRVGPAGEPGDSLIVSGRVLSRQTHLPLAGVTLYTYHADINGEYNLQGQEAGEPRLCGVLRTNQAGQYRIRTTMPGGYGGAAPHIHFEVWGKGVERQASFVNLVAKGPLKVMDTTRVSEIARAWPKLPPPRDDASSIERRVMRGKDGLLHCAKDIVVDAK